MDTPHVVVGLDTSDNARAALRWAAEFASKFQLELEAVTAWNTGPSYHPTPEFDAEIARIATKDLHDAVSEELGDDSGVIERVIRGEATPVLLDAARSAALLVVGSRGHGAFAGMLLGSVSQHCIQHAACPVVVVRT